MQQIGQKQVTCQLKHFPSDQVKVTNAALMHYKM